MCICNYVRFIRVFVITCVLRVFITHCVSYTCICHSLCAVYTCICHHVDFKSVLHVWISSLLVNVQIYTVFYLPNMCINVSKMCVLHVFFTRELYHFRVTWYWIVR